MHTNITSSKLHSLQSIRIKNMKLTLLSIFCHFTKTYSWWLQCKSNILNRTTSISSFTFRLFSQYGQWLRPNRWCGRRRLPCNVTNCVSWKLKKHIMNNFQKIMLKFVVLTYFWVDSLDFSISLNFTKLKIWSDQCYELIRI